MATATSSVRPDREALGAVTLIVGPDELLSERAIAAAVAAVRAADADADLTELDAATLVPGALAELTSPSLFATNRAVVVRNLDTVPPESADALIGYAKAPQPDVALVLVHKGGQKGKGTVDKLKKAGVRLVTTEAPKTWELPKFVVREIRSAGGKIDEESAALLVDSVGSDLRSLAGAASQLISDTGGEPITQDIVRKYFAGRAEVTSFKVADAAVVGHTAEALEQLRWALRSGVVPVLVTSAMAGALRGLIKFAGAPRGLRDADLAREVGVAPWKLKSLRGQLRGWTPDGLAAAVLAVAQADADIKGAADDPEYALERMLLAVTAARSRG